MKKIALILLSLSTALMANDIQVFTINGKEAHFINFKKEHLTLSRSCGKNLKKMSCEAYTKGITASFKGIDKTEFAGGINPGVVVCKGQFNAEVVIASNQFGDNAFCRFPDNSMIDAGSLIYYANKH